MEKGLFLGIDTSNYKTSMAVVDQDGTILSNHQRYLDVKLGERGLRQSEALFQHVNRLPEMTELVFQEIDNIPREVIRAVSVSTRPRPVEGSYMPVFLAGIQEARAIGSALRIPVYEFSHQEGHIEAVRFGTPLQDESRFVSFHFSGGTTEAILVEEEGDGTRYTICGGSRDISYGQLLDRVGVALGMSFPSGEEMDQIAVHAERAPSLLPKIRVNSCWTNLSGIESACQRACSSRDPRELITDLFQRITDSISEMTRQIAEEFNVHRFLFAGGVSSSEFVRSHLIIKDPYYFGKPELSTDNAAGIALLGRKRYGTETDHGHTTE